MRPKHRVGNSLRHRKRRARTLGKLILEMNGIERRVSRGKIQGERTMRYDLAVLDLGKHAKYLRMGGEQQMVKGTHA